MQPDGDSKVPENVGLDNALKRKNSLWKLIQRIPLQIKEIDKPVIAAVNGLAIGAGMDMALACDICFCSDKARFSEGYIKLGLVPGDGGAYFLPRIVGTQKALELLWTGDEIDAEEAYKLGIVSRVFQHEKLMEQTLTFAKKVANANPTAISMIKRSVYQGLNMDLKTALDMISSHMAVITDTDEFKETVRKLKKEM